MPLCGVVPPEPRWSRYVSANYNGPQIMHLILCNYAAISTRTNHSGCSKPVRQAKFLLDVFRGPTSE